MSMFSNYCATAPSSMRYPNPGGPMVPGPALLPGSGGPREATVPDCYQPQAMLFRDPMQGYPHGVPGMSGMPIPGDFYFDPSLHPRYLHQHIPPELYSAYTRHGGAPFPFPPSGSYSQKQEGKTTYCEWMREDGEVCNMPFFSYNDLASHLANHHIQLMDSQEHVCHWKDCCRSGAPFKAKYKLVNHVRVHTGEKPFKCNECNKVFARSENMKIHMRTHTGEKPFKCTKCEKHFANSSDRKKHMHVHNNNKPYYCKAKGCGKTYTHPSSLRKHLKAHEKNCLTPDMDESSDSGHASAGSPTDDFATAKCEQDMGFSFVPTIPSYAQPPTNFPQFPPQFSDYSRFS